MSKKEGLKRCSRCKKLLLLGEFGKDARAKDKLYGRCRNCARLVNKEWRSKNKERYYRSVLKSIKKYPDKQRARELVYKAVRNGAVKKELCFCGSDYVHAHHQDYSKPLIVIWLCPRHHKPEHIKK